MKLKTFQATKVFNFLDFNINFDDRLSFLIGTNGSGKTTVLRLIQALLTPSLSELMIIPFHTAKVDYEDRQKTFSITCKKTTSSITLSASTVDDLLELHSVDQDEINFIISDDGARSDFIKSYQSRHADHPVFRFISSINAPIFLGLERAHKRILDWDGENYSGRHSAQRYWNRSVSRGRRIVEGELTAGLAETQFIVEEAYRRIRTVEARRSHQLRESILLAAFRYQEFTVSPPDREEWERIQQRRAEIEDALENIGISKDRLSEEVGQFFSKLNDLYESTGNPDQENRFPVEWLLNKAQIERVSDLIEIIDENRARVERLYAPMSKFLNIVNSFYVDSGKLLSVNEVGRLLFTREGGQVIPVRALSSGETQLLIIFSHLAFNRYADRSNVFIIDEPELSLHLKWQEQFVTKVLEMRDGVQMIVATHSPEILAGYEDYRIAL